MSPHVPFTMLVTGRAQSLEGYRRARGARSTGGYTDFRGALVIYGRYIETPRGATRLDHGPHPAGLAITSDALLTAVGPGDSQHPFRGLAQSAYSIVVIVVEGLGF